MVEYEIEWWKDWLEADTLKRLELVENLPFVRDMENLMKIEDESIRKHSLTTFLNGFFEDLESALHTQRQIEEKE